MENIKKQHDNAKDATGKLKPKYKDEPRYKAIFGYEGEFTKNFEKLSKQMAKDVVKEITILVGVAKNK